MIKTKCLWLDQPLPPISLNSQEPIFFYAIGHNVPAALFLISTNKRARDVLL